MARSRRSLDAAAVFRLHCQCARRRRRCSPERRSPGRVCVLCGHRICQCFGTRRGERRARSQRRRHCVPRSSRRLPASAPARRSRIMAPSRCLPTPVRLRALPRSQTRRRLARSSRYLASASSADYGGTGTLSVTAIADAIGATANANANADAVIQNVSGLGASASITGGSFTVIADANAIATAAAARVQRDWPIGVHQLVTGAFQRDRTIFSAPTSTRRLSRTRGALQHTATADGPRQLRRQPAGACDRQWRRHWHDHEQRHDQCARQCERPWDHCIPGRRGERQCDCGRWHLAGCRFGERQCNGDIRQ